MSGLPLSYAVDGMHHVTLDPGTGAWLLGDIAIVLAYALASLLLGAATLRRRTN